MRDTPSLAAARAAMHEQASAFRRNVIWSTCPLYETDPRGVPSLFGTGVLFAVGHRRFVISAGHVFRTLNARPLGIVGSSLATLDGQRLSYTSDKSDAEHNVDLAIVELADEQVRDLGNCRYLTFADVDLDEQPDLRRPDGSKYFVLGFPWRIQDHLEPGQPVHPKSAVIHTLPSSRRTYERLRLDPQRHIVLDFDRRNRARSKDPEMRPS